MKIALVDDDAKLLQALHGQLRGALKNLGIEADALDCFPSGEAFLKHWQPGSYEIVILDIYMEALTGVEVARTIRQQDEDVVLAFCTSSNEFASESYEVGARYYLQKPISPDKLSTMLKRLDLDRLRRSRSLRLPDGHKCLLRQILYTEYSNHSVIFHFQDAPTHSVYMNHSQAEDLLLGYRHFCCINKGCIVNLLMVQKLSDSTFYMKNGEALPIARRRFKEVSDAYTRCRFERMDEEVSQV